MLRYPPDAGATILLHIINLGAYAMKGNAKQVDQSEERRGEVRSSYNVTNLVMGVKAKVQRAPCMQGPNCNGLALLQ